jgi:hypothetical protein
MRVEHHFLASLYGESNMTSIVASFTTSLGHCMICMRTAFIAAAITTCAAGVIYIAFGASPFTAPIFVASVGLIALWMAHILVFSKKTSQKHYLEKNTDVATVSRRNYVALFAKTAAFAALATAVPTIASACGGQYSACNSDKDCCAAWVCISKKCE